VKVEGPSTVHPNPPKKFTGKEQERETDLLSPACEKLCVVTTSVGGAAVSHEIS
jgi:hypothetical protein